VYILSPKSFSFIGLNIPINIRKHNVLKKNFNSDRVDVLKY